MSALPSPPTIRPLQDADAAAYRTLMLQAYADETDAFTSTAAERAAAPLGWWVERAADPAGSSRAFGAFDDAGRLVGSVAVEFSQRAKTRHKAMIVGMYVAPAWRRGGVGRALLDAAIAHARARPGIAVLGLTVTEGNAGALRLYESLGFVRFGLEPWALFSGGRYLGKLHMSCLLTPLPAPPRAAVPADDVLAR